MAMVTPDQNSANTNYGQYMPPALAPPSQHNVTEGQYELPAQTGHQSNMIEDPTTKQTMDFGADDYNFDADLTGSDYNLLSEAGPFIAPEDSCINGILWGAPEDPLNYK